ncbi:uncharacterized protein LOC126891249 [Diabrotica virgifera virgifera]|uniref:Double jelly roll-like domain-containing protein n=1 Tax=Diabrotica virgifera virgifera TaxID=50390 RepID=A0ABM5L1S0_DIAVI|nr:uncharacterized protein LOC126891249 [Diabrotica virgifera virgifera]
MYGKRAHSDSVVMPPIFDIYRKPIFDEAIRKAEYRTYAPFIKSFNCNDIVEFSINQVDSFFAMSETLLCIKGSLEITGNGDVKLANNVGAFLFDSCTYSESAREMETVRDPGIVSAVRAMTCYTQEDSNYMVMAGWNYPKDPILNDTSFNIQMPLKHIFNIFNDYPMITCGRQTIRLVRARNDNDCIVIKEKQNADKTPTVTTAKINITNIELRVKHIFPNDEIKLELMKSIQQDQSIVIPFRKWELHELPAITKGARREVWAVKTSTSVERPRYVIVFFQTGNSFRKTITSDPTLFDNVSIQSIRLSLNGEYWPNERMQLDFSKTDYNEAYFNYTEFYPSYIHSQHKRPLLDFLAFKNRALFVIDCSKQEESMKASTVDVKLDIEASTGFPANTKAYCIIIHDCVMEYFPLTEIVKSLT